MPENFYFDSVSLEVSESVKRMAKSAESLGARISYVRLPDVMAMNTLARVILLAEASALLEPYLSRRDDFGQDVLLLLDQGRLIPATHYVNAQRLRRALRFVPVTVLTAIFLPEMLLKNGVLDVTFGNPRFLAGVVGILVAWRTKNVLLTIIAGMAALWLLQALAL